MHVPSLSSTFHVHRAAALDDVPAAQCALAKSLFPDHLDLRLNGDVTALDLLQAAAHRGHAEAQYLLGKCLARGIGMDQDMDQAVALWESAATAGIVDAMADLGQCLYVGDGVPKDQNRAVQLWRAAADKGHSMAQWNLGLHLHQQHQQPPPQPEAAANHVNDAGVVPENQAGNQANNQANHRRDHNREAGLNANRREVLRLWTCAAENGNADAQCKLAEWYMEGADGVRRDVDAAVRLWSLAAADRPLARHKLHAFYSNVVV